MNLALWIVHVVLAAMFALAGVMNSTRPKEALARHLPWAEDLPPAREHSR